MTADRAKPEGHELLARTWNRNECGLLWAASWYRQNGRYWRQAVAAGVFVRPSQFPNEDAFWSAFEEERADFYGQRLGGAAQ